MSLYGAQPRRWTSFQGAAPDVPALELPEGIAAAALNIDPHTWRKRLGRVALNASAPVASRTWGVYPYYPVSANRIVVMQAGTKVYADNNRDGDFGDAGEELQTGLTGGRWMDFLQWKTSLLWGNGIDAFSKSSFSAGVLQSAAAVAILSAPTSALTITPEQTPLEAFDSATTHATDPTQGWVLSGNNWTPTTATDISKDGTAIKLTTGANNSRGSYRHKRWSAGTQTSTTLNDAGGINDTDLSAVVTSGTGFAIGDYWQIESEMVKVTSVAGTTIGISRGQGGTTAAAHADASTVTKSVKDLSKLRSVVFWVYAERSRLSFQIAIKANDGTLDFGKFPIHTVSAKKTWTRYEVPLGVIASTDRNASPGFAIKFVDAGDVNLATTNVALWFDDARGLGPFEEDEYSYYYTYAIADSAGNLTSESNPVTISSAIAPGKYLVKEDTPISALTIGVTGTGATGVNKIPIYRIRKNGVMRRARLLTTLANPGSGSTTTYTDQRSDEDLLIEDAPEMVVGRLAPPLADTYALVNNRLLAGNVTLSSVKHPYRLYLSRFGFPEEFSETQEPSDPNAAGWVDIPTKDQIVRILDFDGAALIFCNRSVWTLQGSGWDDFSLQKRCDVGLDAREAVEPFGRAVYFLAHDGFRVLVPHEGYEGSFSTWVISEPYDSRLRAIPAGYRSDCCTGIDHQGRVHLAYVRSGQTVPLYSLVFDPQRPGALDSRPNPARPGWTEYLWPSGASVMTTLKHGGGDYGQLIAGDYATGKLYYTHRNGSGADLETDDGSAVAWEWQGGDEDAGPGRKLEWVIASCSFIQGTTSMSVTLTPILDGAASGTTYSQAGSSSSSAGIQQPTEKRTGAAIRARTSGLKLSGSHSAAITLRSAEYGRHLR